MKVLFTTENVDHFPAYGTAGSSGFDIIANETIVLQPGEYKAVATGWRFAFPEGFTMLSCSRSGNSMKRGLISHIAPGVIDPDYRGEVKACVRNVSKETQTIQKGERIVQGVFVKTEKAEFEQVTELLSTERGSGGFGSTGTK